MLHNLAAEAEELCTWQRQPHGLHSAPGKLLGELFLTPLIKKPYFLNVLAGAT